MSRFEHHTPNYCGAQGGGFGLPYHLEMLSDTERVRACKAAIAAVLSPQTVFCELGCGTGVFSLFASRYCARVYAVEKDHRILEIAERNARQRGLLDRIIFIHADALVVELPEQVDVLFCEMMSIWLINEPQIPVMNRARRDLLTTKGAVAIPRRVVNIFELANMDYVYEGIELRAAVPQFSGVTAPRIMTEAIVANEIDMSGEVSINTSVRVRTRCLVEGVVNCARLTSIVDFAAGVSFYSTNSLMPATIVPLQEELKVKQNEKLLFCAEYAHRTSLDDSRFWCETVRS